MKVAILNHATQTVTVINVTAKDLKPFNGDIEEYLYEKDLIDSNCEWMGKVKKLKIVDHFQLDEVTKLIAYFTDEFLAKHNLYDKLSKTPALHSLANAWLTERIKRNSK